LSAGGSLFIATSSRRKLHMKSRKNAKNLTADE